VTSNIARYALLTSVSVLIGVLLLATGFLVRVVTEPATSTPAPATAASADTDADFSLLEEIARIIEQDYVDPDRVDAELLRDGAIEGIFRTLNDPHSAYIDPRTYALSRDDFEGAFHGIGATVSRQGDWVVITQPLPDTPAERAGIQAGTVILEVDGESAEGWSVEEAVLRIRGPMGTEVTLLVRFPDGTEEAITIVRDSIPVHSVSRVPPGGVLRDADGELVEDVGYVRIGSFTRATPDEFEEAIAELEAEGVRGLILDVRSNAGGLLQETLIIADMLLDSGVMIVQVDRSGAETVVQAREGMITDLPIVLLQDEFSASGSELLAAALQDNGRATVMGTRSFGKGSVNHVRELSNGGAVYVSIARWLTPDRNQIEGRGILPDVPVEMTLEDIEQSRDIPVYRAIELLRTELVAAG
jgi:carboxyl-terminal processing protease